MSNLLAKTLLSEFENNKRWGLPLDFIVQMSIQVIFREPETNPGLGIAAESETMLRNHCLSGMADIASHGYDNRLL